MSEEIVIFVTTGSEDEAKKIAANLVEGKLVACANIVSSVQSIFHWQGGLCNEGESLMILKSVKTNLNSIITRVKQLHSYDVPEIIAIPIIAGSEEYLNWINAETKSVEK